MKAGLLDRTVTLERATVITADDGTPDTTWTTLATLRAQLVGKTADERHADFGAETVTSTTLRTRWLDGVTVTDRLRYAGTVYNIIEVTEIGRREGLELRCTAKG